MELRMKISYTFPQMLAQRAVITKKIVLGLLYGMCKKSYLLHTFTLFSPDDKYKNHHHQDNQKTQNYKHGHLQMVAITRRWTQCRIARWCSRFTHPTNSLDDTASVYFLNLSVVFIKLHSTVPVQPEVPCQRVIVANLKQTKLYESLEAFRIHNRRWLTHNRNIVSWVKSWSLSYT